MWTLWTWTTVQAALAYGSTLRTEYKEAAKRPEVHVLLERMWSTIAYHFPVETGGDVGRWAGQDAWDALVGEVNQAILGAWLCDLSACSIVLMIPSLFPPLVSHCSFLTWNRKDSLGDWRSSVYFRRPAQA